MLIVIRFWEKRIVYSDLRLLSFALSTALSRSAPAVAEEPFSSLDGSKAVRELNETLSLNHDKQVKCAVVPPYRNWEVYDHAVYECYALVGDRLREMLRKSSDSNSITITYDAMQLSGS